MKLHFQGSVFSYLKEDFRLDVLEIAFGRAHLQSRFFGSYAAHGGGRWAVFSEDYAAPCGGRLAVSWPWLHLLVEGRPILFLLVFVPHGRQWRFIATSKIYGSLVVPSDFVPGGGEVCVMELLWTRLLSPSGVGGSFCKRQGPLCNFLFSLDLVVRCTNLIII
jgi:hypothetical protein